MLAAASGSSCRFLNTQPTEKHCEMGSVPLACELCAATASSSPDSAVGVSQRGAHPCGMIPSVTGVSVSKQACGCEAGPSEG